MGNWLSEFKEETDMLEKLQLEISPEMVVLATIYKEEGMDGVIRRFRSGLNLKTKNTEFVEKILEFSQKIREHNPEISKKISSSLIRKLVHQAQLEQSRHNNHNGDKPVCRLGEAIFGNRWKILLRATI